MKRKSDKNQPKSDYTETANAAEHILIATPSNMKQNILERNKQK